MKRFHKLTAWVLTLAMLMTFIPSFTLTVNASEVASGTIEAKWGTSASDLSNSGTLADAIDAAEADSSITYVQLQSDVDSDLSIIINSGEFTIDLNGKNITSAQNTISVAESGTKVTFIDSTQTDGTVSTTSYGYKALSVLNGAEIIIDGGSYIGYDGACGLTLGAGTYGTIKNGVFESGKVALHNSGTLVIEDGTFTTSGDYPIDILAGTMTILDGDFTAGAYGVIVYHGGVLDLSECASVLDMSVMSTVTPQITVSDTTIKLPDGYSFFDSDNNATDVIEAYGTYTVGKESAPTTYTVTVDDSIENGTVEADVSEAAEGDTVTLTVTPADGYVIDTVKYNDISITENEGEYIFIMPAEDVVVTVTFAENTVPVASVTGEGGTTEYTSFAAAVDAAQEGDTITLLDNVLPYGITFNKCLTIENNGFMIEGFITCADGYTDIRSFENTHIYIVKAITINFNNEDNWQNVRLLYLVDKENDAWNSAFPVSEEGAIITYKIPEGTEKIEFINYYFGQPLEDVSEGELRYVEINNPVAGATYNNASYSVVGSDYNVIIDSTTNGTVTSDKTIAAEGDTVTLTVTPAEGYEIDTVSYNDGTDDVEITATEGVYSFTMPAGDVTVTATFGYDTTDDIYFHYTQDILIIDMTKEVPYIDFGVDLEYYLVRANETITPWVDGNLLYVKIDADITTEDVGVFNPLNEVYAYFTYPDGEKFMHTFKLYPVEKNVMSDMLICEPLEITYGESNILEVTFSNNFVPGENGSIVILDGETVWKEDKNKRAGEYVVTVVYEDDDNYGSKTTPITIEPKELTPTISGTVSKVYDGTTSVPDGLSITLDGIIGDDKVTACASYEYVGTDVGTTEITATDIELSGDDAMNYKVNSGTVSADAGTITKATPAPDAEKVTTARVRRGQTLANATVTKGNFLAVDGTTVLDGTFAWVDDTKEITADSTEKMKFTPTDTNYTEIEIDVAVDSYTTGGGGGSSSNTTTTTTKNEDGSTTKVTENKATGTKTEVTTNTDGSTTTVETKKDGTVTTTEKDKDGNTTTTVEKSDGTIVTTEKDTDGTKTVTTENADGSRVTEEVRKDGTEVKTETNADGETTTEVEAKGETEVVIPVENAEDVTKVIVTDENGKETEARFEVKDGGIAISVSGNSTVSVQTGHTCYAKEFTDVDLNAWYHFNIDYVLENGLMFGTDADTFSPDEKVTRAMLVTVLYRMEGEPAVNRSIPFSDVDMGAYYANAVSWAKQNGIVAGYNEKVFAPGDNITREQIAAIIYRYAQYKGTDAVTLEENLHFEDNGEISDYAVPAMNWAVGKGLIKGKTEITVNPGDNSTRAEIAAILHRFAEVK